MWVADNITHANMLLYPLLYKTIISLISLNITQAFHLLLGFAENKIVFWDFKIQNSIRITEGLDNRDSDNQGSTVRSMYVCIVHMYTIYTYIVIKYNICLWMIAVLVGHFISHWTVL